MKKITKQAVTALYARRNFNSGNTSVKVYDNGIAEYFLHGNRIAVLQADGKLSITNAGWPTNTTYERLRGLPEVSIRRIKGQTYLNGKLWDGAWIEVVERVGNRPTA